MTSLPYSIRPKTGPDENDATQPMIFSKTENSFFNTVDRRDAWLEAAIKTLGGQHA